MFRLCGIIFALLIAPLSGKYIQQDIRDNWYNHKIDQLELPATWYWGDVDGVNYLTKNLNQHLPQWCGSCWAHGALSSLGDRVKIARNASRPDINLPVQFLLNCGHVGSCNGGDHLAAYRFIKETGGIPFDTCLQYEACSSDSHNEVCKNRNFSCIPKNICRTCTSQQCVEIFPYPKVTVNDYRAIKDYKNMMAEIYENGPIACAINSLPVANYQGGIVDLPNESHNVDHIISIVGWGYDEGMDKHYWIIRNSWGEFWGELGFLRLVMGENQLGVEGDCAAAVPGNWTTHNVPCDLDGKNCVKNL